MSDHDDRKSVVEELKEEAKAGKVEVQSESFAKLMDEKDPLAGLRSKFHVPPHVGEGKECIYLCGNSLGLQPKKTKEYVMEELDIWANKGVEGHFEEQNPKRPWVITDEFVHQQSAKIVGAEAAEVAIMNSLTVNLHLMMIPFYRPTDSRFTIIMEAGAFPSDRYAVASQLKLRNISVEKGLVELSPREGEHLLRTEDIVKAIEKQGERLALVMLSGVQYYTGQYFHLEEITAAAHKVGAFACFDLAHAVGNVPLQLHDWNVDGACWCTYKYLNSGPGNIGGFFIHQNHAKRTDFDRLAGWWGHDLSTRFDMRAPFNPIEGAFGYRLSNPPVLCTAALLGSLELFEEATMKRLRVKSRRLTGYLEYLLDTLLGEGLVEIITPRNPEERGAQLSLLFKCSEAQLDEVSEKLQASGVVCDIRKPNVVRIAPTPLYNRFTDVFQFVQILSTVKK